MYPYKIKNVKEMRVKSGTTNDLIYHELRRGDIISKIKDRQHNFYHKLILLSEEEAIVKTVINICCDTNIIAYYKNLNNHNYIDDITNREVRINLW